MLSRNITRGIFILVLQVLILKRIDFGTYDFYYLHIIIYPLIILLLPIKTPAAVTISIGFFTGLFVDMFYDSPGVHASAAVFIAYVRSYVLKLLEPYGGYKVDTSPTPYMLGTSWFLSYISILFAAYLLWYFSVESFSFIYYKEIILRTICSFLISMAVSLVYIFITNPKH